MFMRVTATWKQVCEMATTKHNLNLLDIRVGNQPPRVSAITQPGQPIPGSDIGREMLIDPILREGEIAWLYGKEKTGKSWVGLTFAYIAAKGHCTVGKWSTKKKHGVLYIDGEMLPDDLENNTQMVMRGFGDMSEEVPFSRLCAKSQPSGVISLLDDEWKQFVLDSLEGIKLVILDNFYSLTDNKVTDIKAMGELLHQLSQRGIATLVLDHTNAEGDLQGSLSKRRMASLCAEIRDIGGNQLFIAYPTARRLHGDAAAGHAVCKVFTKDSFRLELVEQAKTENKVSDKIQELALIKYYKEALGYSYKQIESKIGVKSSTAHQRYSQQIPQLNAEEKPEIGRALLQLSLGNL